MPYQVKKKYGHNVGLSCAFRQPKALHSHCSKLHGYSLAFSFVFESEHLDARNWVIDFGGLKSLKAKLHDLFDHKVAVDAKDPALEAFQILHDQKVIDMVVFEQGVGCERFALKAFHEANRLVAELNSKQEKLGKSHRIRVVSCTCAEHDGNSATYINPNPDPV
jgi:6-pyruvoyltetrahydropterin/6-carboxytetrahydropterin synthase